MPLANLALRLMLPYSAEEPVIIAHSPETKVASAELPRPLYTNKPCLDMLARFSMWRTCSGVLRASLVSRPLKPLRLVANSTLCQAEKLSSWVQLTHEVVNGHLWPAAFRRAAASTTSGHVFGGFSVSSPAALNASLL